jgi:nucleoside-diphosphate-sugar epimerase
MNAFVTGASGFIGGHLAAALVRNGAAVRGLIRRERHSSGAEMEFIRGDLADRGLIAEACRGIDVVFHCAAALGASPLGAEEFRATNAGGTRNLLQAAREAGVRRVVHFSSAGVLGHVKKGRIADEKYSPDPRDIYDRTKLEGERIALEAADAGLDVVVIRPGWVYGPGDRRTLKLIRAISRRRFARVGTGRTLQTPVYIDDLIAGTLLCAEKGRSGEIYNLAGSEVMSVMDMAAVIAETVGVRLPKTRLPLLPTRGAAWFLGRAFGLVGKEAPLSPARLAFFLHPKPLDIEKARRDLGFAPRTSFREGMKKTAASYREAGWL